MILIKSDEARKDIKEGLWKVSDGFDKEIANTEEEILRETLIKVRDKFLSVVNGIIK